MIQMDELREYYASKINEIPPCSHEVTIDDDPLNRDDGSSTLEKSDEISPICSDYKKARTLVP